MTHPRNPETRGLVLMLLSIVFFTMNTLAIRGLVSLYPDIDGWHASLFRGIAGLAVVFIVYGFGRGLRMKSLFQRPLVILRGLIGGIGIAIFYITVIELGPGRSTVINVTYPIFAALIAAVVLKERLSLQRFFWILIGFLGLTLFLSEKAMGHGMSFYDFLAIIGAVMGATVVVIIRKLHQSEHGSTIYSAQAFYSIVFALPVSGSSTLELPLMGIILLLLAGAIVAGGQLSMTFAYRYLEVSKGASLQMLLPITTATGAWFLFGETFGTLELCGAALTLGATWMINRETSKAPKSVTTIQPQNS